MYSGWRRDFQQKSADLHAEFLLVKGTTFVVILKSSLLSLAAPPTGFERALTCNTQLHHP